MMPPIVIRKVDDLHGYEKNAKKHPPEQVKQIAHSLHEFGWKQPFVVDVDGCIVIGHGRFEAAKSLGMEVVPCIIASDLAPEQIKAFRLVDNKTNESPWDYELRDIELSSLCDIDMSTYGFPTPDEILLDVNDDDFLKGTEITKKKKEKQIVCPKCGEVIEL